MLWRDWPGIVAIASDSRLPDDGVRQLDLHNPAHIADFVVANAAAR